MRGKTVRGGLERKDSAAMAILEGNYKFLCVLQLTYSVHLSGQINCTYTGSKFLPLDVAS